MRTFIQAKLRAVVSVLLAASVMCLGMTTSPLGRGAFAPTPTKTVAIERASKTIQAIGDDQTETIARPDAGSCAPDLIHPSGWMLLPALRGFWVYAKGNFPGMIRRTGHGSFGVRGPPAGPV